MSDSRRTRRHSRQVRRRKSWDPYGGTGIKIRVGSSRSARRYHEVEVTGPRDAPRFARLVEDQVHAYPRDPLIISINGYQPWLEDVLGTCLEADWDDISDLDREVQFAGTMQFPEKSSKREQNVPWTFVIDHMNVPEVYYWSVGMEPPVRDESGLPDIDNYRFRVGAWLCGRGVVRFDKEVPVALIFTRPTPLCEHVVTELLFTFLWKDEEFDQPREDEEGICWLFSRLYFLLSDWQNIIGAVGMRLDEAEANSHGRHLPVKLRTRLVHQEVGRLYEFKEYLHFHTRSFKKLQKLKDDVPEREQKDPIWSDMSDAVEDLEQFDSTLDGLKERFNNLLDLEFNLQNVMQADNAQFLSVIATLFLPISFLASIFGITTGSWPIIWYLYSGIPVFILSVLFTALFPWAVRRIHKMLYPVEGLRLPLKPRDFTMLGDELPDSADLPGGGKAARARHKTQRPMGGEGAGRPKSYSRPRAGNEKDGEY